MRVSLIEPGNYGAEIGRHVLAHGHRRRALIALRKVIEELEHLNEGQKFRYDRDALVKMLDDALAKVKQPGEGARLSRRAPESPRGHAPNCEPPRLVSDQTIGSPTNGKCPIS